jgi:anhydro-N-acetylmuramic acid kinase
VIVGGGGAYNPTLLLFLRQALGNIPVLRQEDLGYSSKAKEGLAFAIMGYETLHGRPCNLPSCTGARRAVPLGQITPGDNYERLLRKVLC